MAMFDAERIIHDTMVASVEQHAQLGSTSDRAWQLCQTDLPALPGLILANRQTAGRGRGAAKWWASEGALTFTLVLDQRAIDVPASRLSAVPLAIAEAIAEVVCKFIGASQDVVWVKWPNDVLVGERKLAGVLTESTTATDGRPCLLVGVGLNLNNSSSSAPAEIVDRITSVCDCWQQVISPVEQQQLLIDLLRGFATRLKRLGEGFELQSPCPLAGQQVQLTTAGGVVVGEYVGIDDSGALLLRSAGKLQRIVSGASLRRIFD